MGENDEESSYDDLKVTSFSSVVKGPETLYCYIKSIKMCQVFKTLQQLDCF